MHDGSGGDGGQRAPRRDVLDPRGPMGMPKIVSRLAGRAGRRPPSSVPALLFVLSVLAIMIALGVFLIIGGH